MPETCVQPESARDAAAPADTVRAAAAAAGLDPRLQGKRAVVLVYSYYPQDLRPRRAAEALVRAGMSVDLICLRNSREEKARENVAGVDVLRLPIRRHRKGKLSYFARYAAFLLWCFVILTFRSLKRRYHLVHAHNMPDVLVFSSVTPKLFGARVILDLHDPMPELMTSIYGLGESHWLVRILKRCEQWSIAFSDVVLTPNVAFLDLFVSRGARRDKMHIVMNSPRSEVFNAERHRVRPREPGRFVVMYHGTLVKRHGLHTAVDAMARLQPRLPGLEFHIYGFETPYIQEEIMPQAAALGLQKVVQYRGGRSEDEIAAAIAECDLGIIPNLRTVFTEINLPTRIFEYLALHKPVIAPDTRGIRDYFDRSNLLFFEPGNIDSLAAQILWVHDRAGEAARLVEAGRRVYAGHLWDNERGRMLDLVAELLNPAGR